MSTFEVVQPLDIAKNVTEGLKQSLHAAASVVTQHTHSAPTTEVAPALKLSQLEQAMPRGWCRPVFFFSVPGDVDQAVEILRKGLEPTKKAFPYLSAELFFDETEKQSGVLALRPGDFGNLIVKDLRGKGLAYEELRKQNFPASRLDPDELCATPIFAVPGMQLPVFVPQANMVEGGIILALSMHHAVIDAQGYREIFNVWAQNCRHVQDPTAVSQCSFLPSEIFEKTAHYARSEPTSEKGRPEHHPEYAHAPFPITSFPEAAFRKTHRTRIYNFSPKALSELKNDCTEPGKPWVSTNDAVTALIWRSVLRAQVDPKEITPETVSRHTICCDSRDRSDPPLAKNYPGSPMIYATPTLNIQETLAEPKSIATIAQNIRTTVDKTDAKYVDSLVTLLNSIPGYDYMFAASFPNLMGTDCMISTWYKLDMYDIPWGPALGCIERARYTRVGLFNGCQVVFPRVTKGEGLGMEVSIGLDMKNFEKLESDPVWMKYATPTDPGYDCL